MDELYAVPAIDELNIAVDNLTNGKVLESNNIPPNLINKLKSALLLPLHKILCQFWQ